MQWQNKQLLFIPGNMFLSLRHVIDMRASRNSGVVNKLNHVCLQVALSRIHAQDLDSKVHNFEFRNTSY